MDEKYHQNKTKHSADGLFLCNVFFQWKLNLSVDEIHKPEYISKAV